MTRGETDEVAMMRHDPALQPAPSAEALSLLQLRWMSAAWAVVKRHRRIGPDEQAARLTGVLAVRERINPSMAKDVSNIVRVVPGEDDGAHLSSHQSLAFRR